jgi:hypothetical protein
MSFFPKSSPKSVMWLTREQKPNVKMPHVSSENGSFPSPKALSLYMTLNHGLVLHGVLPKTPLGIFHVSGVRAEIRSARLLCVFSGIRPLFRIKNFQRCLDYTPQWVRNFWDFETFGQYGMWPFPKDDLQADHVSCARAKTTSTTIMCFGMAVLFPKLHQNQSQGTGCPTPHKGLYRICGKGSACGRYQNSHERNVCVSGAKAKRNAICLCVFGDATAFFQIARTEPNLLGT